MTKAVFLFLISGVIGLTGSCLITYFGSQLGLTDYPKQRSSHYQPTPKGGGVGLLAAWIGLTLWLGISPYWAIPAAILSLVSLWNDRRELPPVVRLLVQFAATGAFLTGVDVSGLTAGTGWIVYPLAFLFIVATTNMVNFMDGINGIAGITGVVGFGLLAAYSSVSPGQSSMALLMAGLAAACLGFLPFNIPRARVFMGDVGSILLGFVYATAVIVLGRSIPEYILLCGFMLPFYVDEGLTSLTRLRDGENLLRAHRRHIYQLLANEGRIAHWKVSTAYGVLQLLIGASLYLAFRQSGPWFWWSIGGWIIVLAAGGLLIRHRLEHH